MDRFNSLDALVAESKKKFHMLIKFGSLENLERFQSGSLYMKNLRFYNELECEHGNGKPDKYDGKWRMNGGQFVLIDPSTSTLVASGTARETIFSFGYEKYPVFCLFCCDERNCGNYQVDKGACVIPVSFSAEQVQKLKTALGTYALIILDTDEFLTRVDKAFCQENISYMKSCVSYNQGNCIERVNSILSNRDNIAFNKDAADFSYQQEFRFLVTNRPVEEHLSLFIGDLHDITKIVPTDELLKYRIELRQDFTQIAE